MADVFGGVDASIKLRALVCARLMIGDFHNWVSFSSERSRASEILNRRVARHVFSQLPISYRETQARLSEFIHSNFVNCTAEQLAKICDSVQPSEGGLNIGIIEFERNFVQIDDHVEISCPFHSNVSISLWGLKFEFPEHHFLNDLEWSLTETVQAERDANELLTSVVSVKDAPAKAAAIATAQKAASRSTISVCYNLLEAYINGVFFQITEQGYAGLHLCSAEQRTYAQRNKTASFADRVEKLCEIIKAFDIIDSADYVALRDGKFVRDAIHHTSPFGWTTRNAQTSYAAGARLGALYSIVPESARSLARSTLDFLIAVERQAWGDPASRTIFESCTKLRQRLY